jgi:hypothetical protein
VSGSGDSPGVALTDKNAPEIWNQAVSKVTGIAAEHARHYERVAIVAPNRLAVQFKAGYNLAKSFCEQPEQLKKFEAALADLTGQPVQVEFVLSEQEPAQKGRSAAPKATPHQRMLEISRHPMIHKAEELFGAHPVRVDDPPGEK